MRWPTELPDRGIERHAVGLPTVLADGAFAGGAAERAADGRVGERLERAREGVGLRRVV